MDLVPSGYFFLKKIIFLSLLHSIDQTNQRGYMLQSNPISKQFFLTNLAQLLYFREKSKLK